MLKTGVEFLSRHDEALAIAGLSMGTAASDSDRLFEFVFNNPLMGMALVDLKGHFLRVNKCLCEMVGYTEGELLALDFQTITHPDDVNRDRSWIKNALDTPFQREKRYIHKDGHTACAMLTTSLFRLSDGTPRYFVSQYLDITERKRSEEAVRLLESAIDATTCGITIADARLMDMPLVYVNPAFLKMTGFTLDETIGKNCHFLQGSDRDQPEVGGMRQALAAGTLVSTTLRNYRKDGSLFFNEMQISPIRDEEGVITHFVGVANDITDRLAAAQRLAASEERLAEAQKTASIGSWSLQLATNEIQWSAEMYRLLEFDPALGQPSLSAIRSKYLEGDGASYLATVAQARLDGQPYQIDLRVQTSDGSIRWFDARGCGKRNAVGEIVSLHGTMLDVTDRKTTEVKLQALMEALQRSNESLQEFAFIASHDLKEPLRKIHTFGEMLQRKAGAALPADCVDYLARMINASTRLQTLIDGLLDYAQLTHSTPRRICVDVNQIMRDVLTDLEPKIIETKAQVEVGKLPALAGDPLLMRQLLQNLVANALKFHKPDEPPIVRVYCENPDTRLRSRIVVADNGIGFDPKYARKIFGIFERLHGVADGTGIGLAVCQRIVDSLGGTICAESAPGRGARFLVDLDTCVLH